MSQDRRVPPMIEPLLASLVRHGVRYVVFGSGGALLYGANVTPGDFDICPALDPANLERLADVLREIEARPRVIPGWMTADASAAWRPNPQEVETFDHLFETAFGDFDVVPHPYGPNGKADRFDYERLNARAMTTTTFGVPVRVAGIDDLVASKMSRRRDKDLLAWPELQRLLALSRDRS